MKVMLIQLRAERNLTQLQLATRAGVSPMAIYKMEHALPVSQESAEKVLAVLGVSADEVAGLVFSKPLNERVNTQFIQGAHSRKRSTNAPFDDEKGRLMNERIGQPIGCTHSWMWNSEKIWCAKCGHVRGAIDTPVAPMPQEPQEQRQETLQELLRRWQQSAQEDEA